MDLYISGIDQRYDLLIENYEEFTKVKVRSNRIVRMLKLKTSSRKHTKNIELTANRHDETAPGFLRPAADLKKAPTDMTKPCQNR